MEQLERQCEKLDRAQVQVQAFHAFSKLVSDAEVAEALGEPLPARVNRSQLMEAKHRLFAQLPAVHVRRLERLAQDQAEERRRQLRIDRVELRAELQAARKQQELDREARGLRNTVACARFSDDEMEELLAEYNAFTDADMERVQNEKFYPLPVPGPEVRAAIEDREEYEPRRETPWWAPYIAWAREDCRFVAIAGEEDFAPTASLVLVASQSPVKLVFLEMRRTYVVVDVDAGASDFSDNLGRVFDIFPLKHIKDTDFHVGFGEELFVMTNCHFEKRQVHSRSQPIPFEDFVQRIPDRRPPRKERDDSQRRDPVSKAAAAGFREQFLRDHPWLSGADVDLALGRKKPAPHGPRGAALRDEEPDDDDDDMEAPEDDDDAQPDDDDEMEAPDDEAFDPDELAALRDELVVPERRMDFYVHILGGKWTLAHAGVVADGCSYFARAGNPRRWCIKYAFPKQKGFMYAAYGGPEGPQIMCNEIVRRAQFFYDLCTESDDVHFTYTDALLASYVDGEEFLDWMCDLDIESLLFQRGLEVRRLAPLNPL